ncbi:HFL086Wp [Eremothecium sinecaudum]|uniref:Defect at low temperature protein 1 n=1 Tax=Eremothecium sinecaudum TaxID=45286 RepID=A0A0X8HUR7_9SACH|nr:HFL086Wp [Eremothecium sinecaudum]AMD21770.1 HFL086Wp [Eremothecium sinecaudum]
MINYYVIIILNLKSQYGFHIKTNELEEDRNKLKRICDEIAFEMSLNIPTWSRRLCSLLLLLLVILFSLAMPIDCIVRASMTPNDALNMFIVFGALIVIAVMSVVLGVGRILVFRSCMQEIPKRYIPITDRDIPNKECRDQINKFLKFTHDFRRKFSKPVEMVVHDGLEPPKSLNAVHDNKIPPLVNYQTCVKIIADRLKFQGIFINNAELDINLGTTFAQQVHAHFPSTGEHTKLAEKYIDLYETIRYQGKPVTRANFIDFMELTLFFSDLLPSAEKEVDRGRTDGILPFIHSTMSQSDASYSASSSGFRLNEELVNLRSWTPSLASPSKSSTAIHLMSSQKEKKSSSTNNSTIDDYYSSTTDSFNSVVRR